MNNQTQLFSAWIDNARERTKSAHTKLAADEEALTGINDPSNKGTTSIPSHADGNNRKLLNLPENKTNMEEADRQYNIMDVTKPNGTGQGSYVTPVNGNARDAAATSPTSPLDKIANSLSESLRQLQTPTPVQAANFELPSNLSADAGLMDKLAAIGSIMIGTTEGQQAVAEALEREAGIKEASALIAMVNQEMADAVQEAEIKQASTNMYYYDTQMQKQAADAAHATWYNAYQTDLEKIAYAQGAADADALDASAAQGEEPSIPGSDELSDEDVMNAIQEMVQSGEITPQDAEALVQALSADGEVGGTMEQLAAELQQAVQSGEITPEQAEVIAQAILEDAGVDAEGEAPEEAPVPEAAPEEVAKAASWAQSNLTKAANVINDLF